MNPDRRRLEMSKVASKLNLTQVGRVCVTVADTDRAIDFYVDQLGFEKVVDVPMGEAMRWVEVALPGTPTTIALAPPPQGQEAGGGQTGICLDLGRRRRPRRATSSRRRRRRAGHPLGRSGAADVLAARPGRKLSDRRPAVVPASERDARPQHSAGRALPQAPDRVTADTAPLLPQRLCRRVPGSAGRSAR